MNARSDFTFLAASATDGVRIARFHGFSLDDEPLISGVEARSGQVLTARSIVALRTDMVGAQVVLVFENADPDKPIILGVLQAARPREAAPGATLSAMVDNDRVVISAEREVVLQCGKASITLTRAGKVLIQGSYVLSRSTGYNKIKGAAIDIN